jgi:hypothetical protein
VASYGTSVFGEGKTGWQEVNTLLIEVRGVDLVVSLLNGKFKATYYKPPGRPNLILRERTKTDDEALVAEAFQAAVAKARELGWIGTPITHFPVKRRRP